MLQQSKQSWQVESLRFATALLCVLGFMGLANGQNFRTIDGAGNNLTNSTWGSAGVMLERVTSVGYGDGVSTPAGGTRPSARAISSQVCAQSGSTPNSANASDYLWQWGQFLDHDIDLSLVHDALADPQEVFPISVPLGDPFFDPFDTGTQVIGMTRSVFEPGSNPRAQVNDITAFIDASNVYGSNMARSMELRTLDGSGKLKTSAGNLLPFNSNAFPNAQVDGAPPGDFFLAGDERANEQIGLTAMHTLFVREHNRLCDAIALATPGLTGQEIYDRARRIVGGLMQVITYQEFVPILLGPTTLPTYSGYNTGMNPGIMNVFSTACYRVGHTMLSPQLLRLQNNGAPIPQGAIDLRFAFFNPSAIINDGGIEPILKGLSRQRAQEIDTKIIDDVRNFLFGPPGSGGFDLASLNIQRGRDHGLPGYNQARVDMGLAAVSSFAEISSDASVAAALQSTYGNVNDIDVWVGGLAEDHVNGGVVGALFSEVLAAQFVALRDGDRMFYLNEFSGAELIDLENTTLADVIERNTSLTDLPANVFLVDELEFIRGNCNPDAAIDLADAIYLLQYLFTQGPDLSCQDACDMSDDGFLDLTDGIYLLTFLFLGGNPPADPFVACGFDTTPDTLTCAGFATCP